MLHLRVLANERLVSTRGMEGENSHLPLGSKVRNICLCRRRIYIVYHISISTL